MERKPKSIAKKRKQAFFVFDNVDCLISDYKSADEIDTYTKLKKVVQSISEHNIKMAFTSRISKAIEGVKTIEMNRHANLQTSNLH